MEHNLITRDAFTKKLLMQRKLMHEFKPQLESTKTTPVIEKILASFLKSQIKTLLLKNKINRRMIYKKNLKTTTHPEVRLRKVFRDLNFSPTTACVYICLFWCFFFNSTHSVFRKGALAVRSNTPNLSNSFRHLSQSVSKSFKTQQKQIKKQTNADRAQPLLHSLEKKPQPQSKPRTIKPNATQILSVLLTYQLGQRIHKAPKQP